MSSMEKLCIAAAIKDRKFYEKAKDFLDPKSDFSPVGARVFSSVVEYYQRDSEAQCVEPATLDGSIAAGTRSDKQLAAIRDYVSGLPLQEISPENVRGLLRRTRQSATGTRLAVALTNGDKPEEIAKLIEEYEKYGSEEEKPEGNQEILSGVSVKQLVTEKFADGKLIKLWPKALNDKLDGGVRPGHHIVLFAQPEIGKTLFAINLTAGFLKQGLRVLYCGNEDPASDILIRHIMRLSKTPKQDVIADPEKAEERAKTNGYDLLTVASLSPGTMREVERLTVATNANVVILDQLRNIAVDSGTRVEGLEKVATEARNLGKRRNVLVVSLTQAGASATNKAALGMEDVDFSKTGIPAQADLMIGIGADEFMKQNNFRRISLPKNKLSGNHAVFDVEINPLIGAVKDVAL